MNDKNGNQVKIGDVVKVIAIYDGFLQALPDDERLMHEAMLNKNFIVDDIVENGTKASISFQQETEAGIYCGGLYMLPHEFVLVKRSEPNENT